MGPIAQVLSSGVGIGGSMETSVRQEGASRKRDLGCVVCGYGPRAGMHRFPRGSYGFNWILIRGFPHLLHAYVPPKEVEA